jgi:hypothetical protein
VRQIYDIDGGGTFDCTRVGCDLYWAPGGRVIAVLRNRWQGSRDAVRLTLLQRMRLEDLGPSDKEAFSTMAKDVINQLIYERKLQRGVYFHGWRVTSTGHIVK